MRMGCVIYNRFISYCKSMGFPSQERALLGIFNRMGKCNRPEYTIEGGGSYRLGKGAFLFVLDTRKKDWGVRFYAPKGINMRRRSKKHCLRLRKVRFSDYGEIYINPRNRKLEEARDISEPTDCGREIARRVMLPGESCAARANNMRMDRGECKAMRYLRGGRFSLNLGQKIGLAFGIVFEPDFPVWCDIKIAMENPSVILRNEIDIADYYDK